MSQAAKEAPSKGYSAVRDEGTGVGIMELSDRGRILVSGSDAQMFLNGLVTNDVKTLAVNSWMPAAFVSVQGRLLAAVRIIHRADGYLIDTEAATRARVFNLLERFTLAGDFKVKDISDTTALLSLQGEASDQFIRSEFGRPAIEIERQGVFRTDKNVYIVPATHTAANGFDIFLETDDQAEELWETFTLDGIVPIDEDTQERLRIEAGIPRFGVDMDETTLVSETNLDDAISFTKGCYVGQEIIVRIKHRGHVAKKFRGLMTESREPLAVGSTVFSMDGKEIGRVTSATFSPAIDREIGLSYIKYDYIKFGTPVKVGNIDREHIVQVTELPLVRGSWYDLIDNTPFPIASGN